MKFARFLFSSASAQNPTITIALQQSITIILTKGHWYVYILAVMMRFFFKLLTGQLTTWTTFYALSYCIVYSHAQHSDQNTEKSTSPQHCFVPFPLVAQALNAVVKCRDRDKKNDRCQNNKHPPDGGSLQGTAHSLTYLCM